MYFGQEGCWPREVREEEEEEEEEEDEEEEEEEDNRLVSWTSRALYTIPQKKRLKKTCQVNDVLYKCVQLDA